LQAGLLQQVVKLTENYRTTKLLQLPELLIRAYVSVLCHLAAVGVATAALGLTLGLGWAAGLPCSRGRRGGGLPGNGLDAATIQRNLHTHAQYQLQALQVSCFCFEF
jgi:hypothetical protein